MVTNKSRGYAFENVLARWYNGQDGWIAWRLGGSQVALPDVLAINNEKKRIHVHELKTTIHDRVEFPAPQIERCEYIRRSFALYTGYTILSGRFGRPNVKEIHLVWKSGMTPKNITCTRSFRTILTKRLDREELTVF